MMKNISTDKSIIIKNPKKSEFLKICRVLNRADRPYQKIIPDYESFTVKDLNHMKKKYKRSFLIIEYNKKIVGFAAWSVKNQKICWISLIHINPKQQKLGLGTKLLEEIEKIAKRKSCIYSMLELFPKAHWAKKFYLKNDYKILLKKDYKKRIFKNVLSSKAKTLVMIKLIKNGEDI